jgi:hypothetical protein
LEEVLPESSSKHAPFDAEIKERSRLKGVLAAPTKLPEISRVADVTPIVLATLQNQK